MEPAGATSLHHPSQQIAKGSDMETKTLTTISRVLLDRGWNGTDQNSFILKEGYLKGYEVSLALEHFVRIKSISQAMLTQVRSGEKLPPYQMDRWLACQFGDLKFLGEEINQKWFSWTKGSYVNEANTQGMLPLHIAAYHGQKEAVQLLVANGADISAGNQDKDQPLHLAARTGHLAVVQALVERGAPVNGKGTEERTPLHVAAFHGRRDIVQFLISHGADRNARTSKQDGNKSPLLEAVRRCHVEVVKVLLEDENININIRDSLDYTPLRHAVEEDKVDIVKLLAPRTSLAEMDLKDPNHLTALMSFCILKKKHRDIETALAEAYSRQKLNLLTYLSHPEKQSNA